MIELEPFSGWITKKELGKGTFSTVYLAEKNGTYSAIKQIIIPNNTKYNLDFSRLRGNTDEIKKFYKPEIDKMMKEVRLLSDLSGIPGIVIYQDHILREYKMWAGWEILIRMEYLTPLDKYINESGITIREIIQLGIDLTHALDVCSNEGILHRDIKEGNILVDTRGNFKLCDFGVSKYSNTDTHSFTITGTYGYMAPEVEKGLKYDYRADMYSLGIVMYKLLNNYMMPFTSNSDTSNDIKKHKINLMNGKSIPKPANGNEQISRVILKSCKFNPKHRYNDFKDFNNALKALLKKTEPKLLDTYVIDFLDKSNPFDIMEKSYSDSLPDNFRTNIPRYDNTLKKFISDETIDIENITSKTNKSKNNTTWFKKNKQKIIISLHILIFIVLTIFLISIYKLYDKNISFEELFKSDKQTITSSISAGSYIEMGTYLNKPILWECQAVHSKSILLVSKYILCLKSFDSADSIIDGESSTTTDLYGSNKWEESNIRDWLNSKDTKVNFQNNKPDLDSVWKGFNPYSDEQGFLSGFTEKELNLIVEYDHDQITDKVFLLSKYELFGMWNNSNDRQKTPTEAAVNSSNYTNKKFAYNYTWWYWTRDARNNDTYSVNFIDGDGSYNSFENAANGTFGILPAIYINKAQISSGKGTSDDPYTVK
jgi:serine/threonine protein kinase